MDVHARKTLSRRLYAISAVVLAIIIFVALNIAADATLTTERLDLTQNGLYTLSRGTRETIANLKEPITLKFFYSKKIAANYADVQSYAEQVRDLLQEYAALSHGKIILEEVDPEPYTAAEDEATADGLTGAPTDSGDQVYFGLVGTNTIDGQQVIPFFSHDRAPYLEYDLTSLVYRLSSPQKPVVGVISSLPLDSAAGGVTAALQGRSRPFLAYQELKQNYQLKNLGTNFTAIPKNVKVLMIVQPEKLTDVQRYAIDQFVLGGGRALVFVDPSSELAQDMHGRNAQSSSNLPQLFHAWGVGYDPNQIVADRELALQVNVSSDSRNPHAKYPAWLHLTPDQFAKKDQVTADLQALILADVGALSKLKGATTHFTPLVSSSKQAQLLPAVLVRIGVPPREMMERIHPTGKHYVIAARISGAAKTAFPKGPPKGVKTAADAPQIKSAKDINVIVMADTDIFQDRFWVHTQSLYGRQLAVPFADNGPFILNAIENLTGSNALISLRTRATSSRPFTVVQQLQAQAQDRFQQEADTLKQKLKDTETRLHALEQGGSSGGVSSNQGVGATATQLTPAQQAEVNKFRRELVTTRTALRKVQHDLVKEVNALGSFLAFINIALVPILVAAFALLLAILRRRRRARALPL